MYLPELFVHERLWIVSVLMTNCFSFYRKNARTMVQNTGNVVRKVQKPSRLQTNNVKRNQRIFLGIHNFIKQTSVMTFLVSRAARSNEESPNNNRPHLIIYPWTYLICQVDYKLDTLYRTKYERIEVPRICLF